MEFLGIIAGFVLGLVSSWVFWRWQLMIKPQFAVSPQIAVRPSRNDPSKPAYQIKIVNRSTRSIINMTASLGVHEVDRDGGGPGRRTIHRLNLTPEKPTYIGPATRRYDPWSITCVHYYTSGPDDKIPGLLTNGRKLVFTVQATDAMSGTTVLKRYLFGSKDLIKGHFEGRRGFQVITGTPDDSRHGGEHDIAQQSPPAYPSEALDGLTGNAEE